MKRELGKGILLLSVASFLLTWLLLPFCQNMLTGWSNSKIIATFKETYLWIPLLMSILTFFVGLIILKKSRKT